MRALLVFLLAGLPAAAEPVRTWSAKWIAMPGAATHEFGVYHFRRTLELPAVPARHIVRVSADNRYQLFVNGERVAEGPAHGDLFHWRYETVDIAPRLRAGRNVVAATVWNWGDHAPFFQHSAETAFVLQGAGLDTGKEWRVARSEAYESLPLDRATIRWQYYVAPPGERYIASKAIDGWMQPDFDDSAWKPARVIGEPCPRDWVRGDLQGGDCYTPWQMVEREIPPMEEKIESFAAVRRVLGAEHRDGRLLIPPNSRATVLLDHGRVTTAYPELTVSGGRGAIVALRYAESLWEPGTLKKGNRNDIEGKELRGLLDEYVASGDRRTWSPLWWRTFRYLELTVEAGNDPVAIEAVRTRFTAYPLERRARFESDDAEFARILDAGWWTNRLSAHEMFLDAYYEQLQYVADTRISALAALTESGDPRLVRNSIRQIDATRTPDGLTYSRGPSRLPQYTPTFSLLWIGMLHDYWRYVDEPQFVREMLPGARSILSWFARRQGEDGLLTSLPLYNFLDTYVKWDPKALAPYEFHLLQGYGWAAELEEALGSAALAAEYRAAAAKLQAGLRAAYWDEARGLFADNRAHSKWSQHANALAVLTGTGPARPLMEKLLGARDLEPASIYFRFYVHEALLRAGLGDRYLTMLGPWRDLLKQGVTAWPETEREESRSDCHGWGVHPNIDAYRIILGIEPAAPGFSRIAIRPSLGSLRRAAGEMPHPRGTVRATYERNADGSVSAAVDVPVEAVLEWRGRSTVLRPGRHEIRLP